MEPDVFLEHVLYADPISGQCRICSGAGLRSGMQCSNRWQILVLFAFFCCGYCNIFYYVHMFIYIYIHIYILYIILYIYTTSIFYAHVHICIVVAELTHSFWWHASFLSYDRLRSLFQVISVSCFWMLRPLCEGPMQQLPNGLSFQELPAKGLEGSVRYTWLVGLRAKVALENSWITLIFAWILDGSRWYPPVK